MIAWYRIVKLSFNQWSSESRSNIQYDISKIPHILGVRLYMHIPFCYLACYSAAVMSSRMLNVRAIRKSWTQISHLQDFANLTNTSYSLINRFSWATTFFYEPHSIIWFFIEVIEMSRHCAVIEYAPHGVNFMVTQCYQTLFIMASGNGLSFIWNAIENLR